MSKFKHLSIACEAIEFQNGSFFKEMVLVLQPAFSKGSALDTTEQKKLSKQLYNVIFRHVGMNAMVVFTIHPTCVYIPDVNPSSVMYGDWSKFATGNDGLKMINEIGNNKMVVGIVDSKKSMLTGDFSKQQIIINVDLNLFAKNSFTAEECAAIILHEVGHWFTYCETLDRVVTGNMLLIGLSKAMSNGDPSVREIAIKRAGSILDMEDHVVQDLQKTTSDKVVTTVFITDFGKKLMSTQGHSFYDQNTWEMLADQFAVRHGAGRHLVTALDKLLVSTEQRRSTFLYYFVEIARVAMSVLSIIAASIMASNPFLTAILLFSIHFVILGSTGHEYDGAPTYDKPKDRFLRARRQLIEQTKNVNLSPEMIKSISEDVKLIDGVLGNYTEREKWFETVGNFLFSSSRRRKDSVDFQRDLEKLAMNDLFLSAATMRTI